MTDKPRFLVSRYIEALTARGNLIFSDYETYRRPCSLADAAWELRDCSGPCDAISFPCEVSDPDEFGNVVAEQVIVEGLDRRPLPPRTLARLLRLARVETGIIV